MNLMIDESINNSSSSIAKLFENYKNFMSDFFCIFNLMKPDLSEFYNKSKGNKLTLMLLGNKNILELSSYLKSKKEYFIDNDFYFLGKDGLELFLDGGFNILGSCNIRNDIVESDLEDFFSFLLNGIKNKYGSINILYINEKNEIIDLDFFSFLGLNIEYFSSRFGIKYDYYDIDELCVFSDYDKTQGELLLEYIKHIIYGLILEHKLYNNNIKSKSRTLYFDTVKN